MSELNQGSPRLRSILALIVLLLIIIGVQAWYMIKMENQLDTVHSNQQYSTQLTAQNTTAKKNKLLEPVPAENTTDHQPSSIQNKRTIDNTLARDKNTTADRKPLPAYDNLVDPPLYAQHWDPNEEMRRMQQHIDRVFNERRDRFNRRPDYQYKFKQHVSTPKMDVREDDNQYTIYVNIPGTEEDNISVNLEGQRLTIKARQGYKKEDQDPTGRYVFRQRSSGSFRRSLMLQEPVDPDGMRSRVNNGTLTIIIPKARW